MCQIATNFMSNLLMSRKRIVSTCHSVRKWRERIPEFLSKIITGHEMMVCGYDSGTERQSISYAFKTRQDKFRPMRRACLFVRYLQSCVL